MKRKNRVALENRQWAVLLYNPFTVLAITCLLKL